MKRRDVISLYDRDYAAAYDESFLRSPLTLSDSEHELALLRQLLAPGTSWLDVACGTGYFLRHFPGVERAGLDLSPSMLAIARAANPGVSFVERDFCLPMPEWEGRWGLVSCMWYAYGFVESIDELMRLIANLAAWTAPDGTCFVPLADPRLIAGVNLPYHAHTLNAGKVTITGIMWSYDEDDGRKVHTHLIAPNVEFMVEQFNHYFDEVSIHRYPPAFPGWTGRPALLARRKRVSVAAPPGDAAPP